MDKRVDRGQNTRAHIIATATHTFATDGFDDTSIDTILQRAGVSRGALYHHFPGKDTLFRAVLEAEERRVAATIGEAAQNAANPLDALRAGCAAWLRLARDPVIRRVVLIDAPSVVGWRTWREIDDAHGLGLLKRALRAAADAGRLPHDLVDMHAHVLLASLVELALLIARAPDDDAVERSANETIERLLSAALGTTPHGGW